MRRRDGGQRRRPEDEGFHKRQRRSRTKQELGLPHRETPPRSNANRRRHCCHCQVVPTTGVDTGLSRPLRLHAAPSRCHQGDQKRLRWPQRYNLDRLQTGNDADGAHRSLVLARTSSPTRMCQICRQIGSSKSSLCNFLSAALCPEPGAYIYIYMYI